ncbi:unnamed protein product [Brachionus calyciflorus]|uniref:Dendritic cell-specific transmembrane protein-like domain-containing protein n=1 Tax=Brachionus calyciflorus TaxID=104777 RepID=A0A813YVH6_9BILA|nr:unnamed protein product [Brachionus calyciflorus]
MPKKNRKSSNISLEESSDYDFEDDVDVGSETDSDSPENLIIKIKEFDYNELEENICSIGEKMASLIVGKVLIQFLTLNLYVSIKNLKRQFIMDEIQIALSEEARFDEIIKNIHKIEEIVRNAMITEQYLAKIYSQCYEIFGEECAELEIDVLNITETRFFKIFSEPKIINFRLKIGTYSKKLNSKSKKSDSGGQWRFFGKFPLFKIFFPALVYKQDLEKKYSSKFLNDLVTDGTIWNKTIKSIIGLLGSTLITFLIYLYLKFIVQANALKASYFVIITFLVLSVGLVFDNPKFRCIVLLIIPMMASSRGRAIILMNCYTLTSVFVVPNILNNIELLEETYNCNKRLVKEKTKYLARNHDVYYEFKDKVRQMEEIRDDMRRSMATTKKVLQKNLEYVNKSYQALKQIEGININLFGNISTNCTYLIESAFERTTLGKYYKNHCVDVNKNAPFSFLWKYISPSQLSCIPYNKIVCPSFSNFKAGFKQAGTYFKGMFREIKNNTIGAMRRETDKRVKELQDEFEFELIEEDPNHVEEEKMKDKIFKIAQVYKERFDKMSPYLLKLNFAFPVSLVIVVLSARSFHKKYLKRDKFQNYMIGIKFYELDFKRKLKNLPTILPLNDLMNTKFSEIFSISLTKEERHYTIKSITTLSLLLLPVYIFRLTEDTVIGVNQYVANFAHVEIQYAEGETMEYNAKSQGLLTNVFGLIFGFFKDSDNPEFDFENSKCLPSSSPTNLETRKIINISIIVLYVLAVFQSYIKRLRCFFCDCIYGEREQQRTLWLYNRLLNIYSRMGLIERRKTKQSFFVITMKFFLLNILDFLFMVIMILSFYYCFGLVERVRLQSLIQKYKLKFLPLYLRFFPSINKNCITCLIQVEDLDKDLFTKCDNSNCRGYYCIDCFITLDNVCKLCRSTINSNAVITDEVIEKDSSDDEDDELNDVLVDESPNYFEAKKEERLQLAKDQVKSDVLDLEKEQVIQIIDNCFRFYYEDFKILMENELFKQVIEKSDKLKGIFKRQYHTFQDLAIDVIKNFVINLSANDCFRKKELKDINFFLSSSEEI